ncbi:MAG: hypothetical protein CYG60_22065 [Actinobacteria bacterium]|nr:MAG: hypothetical protein CYG60_22065 [Actinomycetota bacterium]
MATELGRKVCEEPPYLGYLFSVPDLAPRHHGDPILCYASSLRVERFSCGRYGVGHTALRHPGEMRGTAVGRQGRFKGLSS